MRVAVTSVRQNGGYGKAMMGPLFSLSMGLGMLLVQSCSVIAPSQAAAKEPWSGGRQVLLFEETFDSPVWQDGWFSNGSGGVFDPV